MRSNVRPLFIQPLTAEGAPAVRLTPEQALRRTVATCLLWENNAYESGQTVADRLKDLIPKCRAQFVAACAWEARNTMHLRHAPLFLVREMARGPVEHRHLVGKLLPDVIQRADELAEFLAIYWKDDPNQPISKQVKKGLAAAFNKFNEYQLAKYDRDGLVKLRDVVFLTHPKPKDVDLAARLVNRDFIPAQTKGGGVIHEKLANLKNRGLETPDTWETELSAGADKKETFTRLMVEGKLGGLAFLRNLRNMHQAGVERHVIEMYASLVDTKKVLPFRFMAAARVVPEFEDVLEPMMLKAMEGAEKLPGRTLLVVDVSSSMDNKLSSKSDLTRQNAANSLAILVREVCETGQVMAFNRGIGVIAPRRGFALADAILKQRTLTQDGTDIGLAVETANHLDADRLIVITDEQSHTRVGAPRAKHSYMINVANMKNGVGYGNGWNHIDGWSEAVVDYIRHVETLE